MNHGKFAQAFHEAAVIATPTLHVLIGHLDYWSYEDDRMDASMWLEAHAAEGQIKQTLTESGDAQSLAKEDLHIDPAETLVRAVEPPALLVAWSKAVGPAPSDLTDEEFALLVPLLPKAPKFSSYPASLLPVTRRSLNGMFYWLTNGVPWSHVPGHYGKWNTLYIRWTNYKKNEVFRRMHLALHGKPEAKRIVEWLKMLDS